jgi:hypothetical protein
MEPASQGQGVLITANHYSATDFQAWWIAIIISAVVPANIHWVVTSGWEDSGWLTGFTHWLFPRGQGYWDSLPCLPCHLTLQKLNNGRWLSGRCCAMPGIPLSQWLD